MDKEVTAGFVLFKGKLGATSKLTVQEFRPLSDRRAFYVLIESNGKTTDTILTYEFVADLPGTKEYQKAVDQYAATIANRMQNLSPNEFFCKSGTPLKVEIYWPIEAVPNRAA